MRQFMVSFVHGFVDAEAGFEVIVRDQTLANKAQSDAAPIEEQLAKQVGTLEAWYAAEFERRLTELSAMLKMQLQIQNEELHQHYERREKVLQEKAQDKAQESTRGHSRENLLEEVKRMEAVAQKCASELERMVADDTVNLGLLLQMRNQQLEVRAYLRGLKFASEGGPASPATHPNHEAI